MKRKWLSWRDLPVDSAGALVVPLQLLEHPQQRGVGVSYDSMTRNSAEQFCMQCVCGIEVVSVFVVWWEGAW